MKALSAAKARAKLRKLIDETGETQLPVLIYSGRNSAVLVSANDWASIQETLFLLSIPGMHEAIKQGMNTPISKCSPILEW